MGIDRLRKTGLFPIEAFAVISEESMIPLCEKYDIDYCFYKNEPLGEKKNFGLSEAYKKDFDYLIEIGSDDLLKNEYLEEISKHLGSHDIMTINNFAYLNSEDGECRIYKSKTRFGIGRVISKSLLSKVGTKLWTDKLNQGMDNDSSHFFIRRGILDKRVISDKPLAIDIKSDVNINAFNYLNGIPFDADECMEGLSEQEINAIKSLYVTV